MADSSAVSSAKSKNQKKRARKKQKKIEEGGANVAVGDEGEREVIPGAVEGGAKTIERREVTVNDPVTELKMKLSEAKANQDHEAAQKIREELWKLRDKGNPAVMPQLSETKPSSDHPQLTLSAPLPMATSDPLDKKLLKLRKKLKQIETLEERKNNGEKMEENQLTKIALKQEVVDEISEIEQIISLT